MKKIILFTIIIVSALSFSCNQEQRERLFEMTYSNIAFDIPAGLSATFPRVFERDEQLTNINFYLNNAQLDTAMILGINPLFARITSLDNGLDYNFVEEVSVRICPENSTACTIADEVFYIDNLRGRAGSRIDLLPTLRNVKRILTQQRYKLEVLFFFAYSTPYTISSRLDMSFEAVK